MRPWTTQLALAGLAGASSYHDHAGVLAHVNPLVGTRGFTPNDNGGMIPSVAPPFAMTRWTPQTRENYISQVPYADLDRRLHGFQATHQPAIWMGESGQVVITPGTTATGNDGVRPAFAQRGLTFRKEDERSTAYVYEVLLDADSVADAGWNLTEQWASDTMGKECPPCPGGAASVPENVEAGAGGRVRRGIVGQMPNLEERILAGAQKSHRDVYERVIRVAMSASAHVGHLRFDFEDASGNNTQTPYVTVQASRLNWTGSVEIDAEKREISGSNSQRQDWALGPDNPISFRGYFVSRFSEPFADFGVTQGGHIRKGIAQLEGKDVGAYAMFSKSARRVEVRTGVSFISIEQARRNLDLEIPDGTTFETTVDTVKSAWLEKMDRISITGANVTDPDHDPRTVFYTGLFHSLQYPSDFSEPTTSVQGGTRRYYSGYTDSIHTEDDSYYQSWSIWDTYRAQHSLLTIFAPERVNSMMRSLLKIFTWSGRLPLWANMVETNIMIATNADVVLANALARGFTGFNVSTTWAAVQKDAYEPPARDTELLYYDREPGTPHEARAGLTSYLVHGWVDNDRWAESASRTLDYAFNDWACAVVAQHAGHNATAQELLQRSLNYRHIWNNETEFMQARNSNGSWADDTWGWTEGDKWVYTFDVMHDVGGLASLFRDGAAGMRRKLDAHFAGGHNMHSNEPSHHVPYLYAMLGDPASTAEQVRSLARSEYNATAAGLSGNEDLGQMSAWYVLSALGFYPVNPASDEYVVGTPFFDEVRIRVPEGPGTKGEHELLISAPGAATKGWKYVKSLKVDGRKVRKPLLKHADVVGAKRIEFEMSPKKTCWGKSGSV